TLPAVLAGFLLLWQRADQTERWHHGTAAGLVLGLTVYSAIVAWLLAPLVCLALARAELPRVRWRLLLATALGGGVALVPMALFLPSHPGMLTARYQNVQAWQPGQPAAVNLVRMWRVYVSGFSHDYLFSHAPWVQGGEFFAVLALALAV